MARTIRVRNPNGTSKTYHGEEAEILTAAEVAAFDARLAATSDADMLAACVPAPTGRIRAEIVA